MGQTDEAQETPSPAREGEEGKEQPEVPALRVPSHPGPPSLGQPG